MYHTSKFFWMTTLTVASTENAGRSQYLLLSHIPVGNLCDDDWQYCEFFDLFFCFSTTRKIFTPHKTKVLFIQLLYKS